MSNPAPKDAFKTFPISSRSRSKRRLVFGVGINDADYVVSPKINGKQYQCPYYRKWFGMLSRCYSNKSLTSTYKECSVSSEWLTFSNFKKWMEGKDWLGNELDKDLLVYGNKLYSADTCLFVNNHINSLLTNDKRKGNLPTGVKFVSKNNNFSASCKTYGKFNHIGVYESAKEASDEYRRFKANHIMEISKTCEESLSALLANHAKRILESESK